MSNFDQNLPCKNVNTFQQIDFSIKCELTGL